MFLSPSGALIACAVVLPLSAAAVVVARHARMREPSGSARAASASSSWQALQPFHYCLLLQRQGLRFADPSVAAILDKTEAIFIFDMSGRWGPRKPSAPTRSRKPQPAR